MTADCVFCERVAGRDFWLPVAETEHCIAAVANHQRSTGSLIVIPRRHALALPDLTDAEATDLLRVMRATALAVERAYCPDAMYVWQGGRIPLAHIHARICPRYRDVPYTFVANDKLALTPMPERREIAHRLTAELAAMSATPGGVPGQLGGEDAAPYTIRGQEPCPVCEHLHGAGRWPQVASSASAVAVVPSRQPTAGTTLVVPRRHVRAPSELADSEAEDLWLLLRTMVGASMRALNPASYHVSQYVGALTGDPLDHLSWRLEPRYQRPPEEEIPVASLPPVPVPERERLARLLRSHLAARTPGQQPVKPRPGDGSE